MNFTRQAGEGEAIRRSTTLVSSVIGKSGGMTLVEFQLSKWLQSFSIAKDGTKIGCYRERKTQDGE